MSDLDDLRRTAYGRDATDAERREATAALAGLVKAGARPLAGLRESITLKERDQRIGRRPLALIAIAAMLVGAAAGAGVVTATRDGATPPAPATSTPGALVLNPGEAASISGPGDVGAAELWFQSGQSASDVPPFHIDDRLVAASSHLVFHSDHLGSVWVARATDSSLCAIISDATNAVGMSCTAPVDFARSALTVGISGQGTDGATSVRWDGRQVLVVIDHE